VNVGQALLEAGFVDHPIYVTVSDLLFAGRESALTSPVELVGSLQSAGCSSYTVKNTNPRNRYGWITIGKDMGIKI